MNNLNRESGENSNPGIMVIGKDYPLFDRIPKPSKSTGGEFQLARNTKLYLEDLDVIIPLSLELIQEEGTLANSFIPYGKGYKLTSEDLQLSSRRMKVLTLPASQLRDRQFSRNALAFSAFTDEKALLEAGMGERVRFEDTKMQQFVFSQEAKSVLERLRLMLMIPGEKDDEGITRDTDRQPQIYEAKANISAYIDGSLWFSEFYPTETGPLPSELENHEDYHFLEEGLRKRFGDWFRENYDIYQIWGLDGNLRVRLPFGKRMLEPKIRFRLAAPEKFLEVQDSIEE